MKEVLGKYREFARQINPKVTVGKGKEWCCYSDTKKIEVPQIVTDETVGDFMETIEKQLAKSGNEKLINKYDDFIWCFLHEMGHLCKPKTYNDRFLRKTLDNLNILGFNKIANFFYYRLREERTATEWACNYVIHHPKTVSKYNWEIVRRYKKYYKSMNLTIDNEAER